MFQHTVSIEGVCVHCGKVIPMVTDPKPKVVNGSYQLVYERCSCSQPAQPQESEEGQKTPTNSAMDAIAALRDMVEMVMTFVKMNPDVSISAIGMDTVNRAKDVLQQHQ